MYEFIKAFCDEKGLSIEQFENLIGVSENYVYKLKYGNPGAKLVVRMSQVMNVPVEVIMEHFNKKGE